MALDGYDQMLGALRDLGKKGGDCVRKAQRDAAKLQKDSCKSAAPVNSGNTRDAIRVRAAKRKKNTIGITVSLGADFFKGAVFYAAFKLFGHHIGKRKSHNPKKQSEIDKSATGRKFIEGDNWMKRAWDSTAQAAADLWERNMKTYLETAVNEAKGKS